MHRLFSVVGGGLLLLWSSVQASPLGLDPQVPFLSSAAAAASPPSRPLHGRFLHITDLHPDPFYTVNSDTYQECHRGRGDAGVLGAETTGCDSPFSLVNETFRWIEENLKDEIDFVIWTGDSARHDNDVEIPRSERQIYMLNQQMVGKMVEVFAKPDHVGDGNPTSDLIVPVVPTLGNNDILPHNIMLPGPSAVTREYLGIWKNFIPEDQYHVFSRGAYFRRTVVPGAHGGKHGASGHGGLSVVSLNTLYFFASNTAVDGCDSKSEPGYEQMEWLKVQLSLMRESGMKAILIGHVPPAWTSAKQSWDESCWRKFVLWSKMYRDVIVGSVFGHMNLDHFMLLDSHELKPPHKDKGDKKGPKKGKKKQPPKSTTTTFAAAGDVCTEFDPENPNLSINSAENYLYSLREAFSLLPSPPQQQQQQQQQQPSSGPPDADIDGKGAYLKEIGGKFAERYILTLVGPSVVPNYFPTLRVVEYNISGVAGDGADVESQLSPSIFDDDDDDDEEDDAEYESEDEEGLAWKSDDGGSNTNDPTTPDPPSKTAPPGPAYSNQRFSWLGYKQYYANLTHINNRPPSPAAPPPSSSSPQKHLELRSEGDDSDVGDQMKRAKPPKPKPFKYELEYDTRNDRLYRMKDLSVRSYLKLAHKIADASGHNGTMGEEEQDGSSFADDDGTETDMNESTIENEEEENDQDLDKNKKKKKKKHGHRGGGDKRKDQIWKMFLRRAFVGTLDDDELNEFIYIREEAGGPLCASEIGWDGEGEL